MRNFFLSILLSSVLYSCNQVQKPRIAIAGLAIESSTFSPAKTIESDFKARTGNDVFSYYPFLEKDSIYRQRADWIPTLRGHAIPGGIVKIEAYESCTFSPAKTIESDFKARMGDDVFSFYPFLQKDSI